MHPKQIEIVEFSEKIYHLGLRHKGINGSLYEDYLIQILKNEIPELSFYKGQLYEDNKTSAQYDIIICKKETPEIELLKNVNPIINLVHPNDCLGVIELKKWAYPSMIKSDGQIQLAYNKFKLDYPELKYIFVSLRFKDRLNGNQNWNTLKTNLNIDAKFCFFGNTYYKDREWEPWTKELINKNSNYNGEFEGLINYIRNLKK